MSEPANADAKLLYERQYNRARDVIRLWKACESATATARTTSTTRKDDSGMWDWKTSVTWALKSCGRENAYILIARLTRQQKSQANSWKSIAHEVVMTDDECEAYFNLGLALFLGELDRRRIPDHYNEWGERTSAAA